MTTSSSRMGIVLKEEHLLSGVSAMIILELRRHWNHFSLKKSCLRDVFPQLPVQPSTECTYTDTLDYDPNLFFDGTCHKTQ